MFLSFRDVFLCKQLSGILECSRAIALDYSKMPKFKYSLFSENKCPMML